MKKLLIVILVATFGLTLMTACTANADDMVGDSDMAETAVMADADDFGAAGAVYAGEELSVEQMMVYAIQDEYLARQTYEDIMAEYGDVTPFRNIIRAEEYHIELMTGLFDKYGYTLPEDDAAAHVVLPRSFEEALQAGVVAEEDNIAMYEKFMAYELPEDVMEAFSELKAASENHLAAFQRGGGGGNGGGSGFGRNS